MKKIYLKSSLLLLLLSISLGSLTLTTGAPEKLLQSGTCSKPTIILDITQGYYADTDGDGFEDDIFVETVMHILCTNRANFDYYITLTLPSGLSFTYAYQVNTRLNLLTFNNDFYDHGIESGDYKVDVQILLKTGGISYTSGSLIFDPPGHSGTDPSFVLSLG